MVWVRHMARRTTRPYTIRQLTRRLGTQTTEISHKPGPTAAVTVIRQAVDRVAARVIPQVGAEEAVQHSRLRVYLARTADLVVVESR